MLYLTPKRPLYYPHLYLVKALGTNLYKVGISRDYEVRLRDLRNFNALPLELVAVWYCDGGAVEPVVHQYLKNRGMHAHHEWFKIHGRSLDGCRAFITTAAKSKPIYTREQGKLAGWRKLIY